MTRVVVTGATGRMGGEVLAAAAARDDVEAVTAVSESSRSEREAVRTDAPVEPAADLRDLLAEREPNALVDFSAPSASVEYVEAAARAGVAAVVGTTGFDDDQEDRLQAAAETVPVLRASNFSRGVGALRAAVGAALERVPSYDIEVTETHHDGKRDAPSGTALTLLDDVAAAGGPSDQVHGREGDAPRGDGEVGVHARRAGDVTGEHDVLLAGNQEVLELTHRAGDRGVFAEGALDAASWVAGRDPGWYDFEDVLRGDDA